MRKRLERATSSEYDVIAFSSRSYRWEKEERKSAVESGRAASSAEERLKLSAFLSSCAGPVVRSVPECFGGGHRWVRELRSAGEGKNGGRKEMAPRETAAPHCCRRVRESPPPLGGID
ncbi:hypothetical protein HPB50_012588 [Hyalomma asiaticum]|uniref:Uncharacterized protein n=1 Tax=Hyalomma asiaticum TaxID=266040 RepID=A0ACB7S2A4_HYAAI|nr:hypothetical protein HPB50_012588 [Hyalomma asiaticum]